MTKRDLNEMFEKFEARIVSLRREVEKSNALRKRLKILSDKMEASGDRSPNMRELSTRDFKPSDSEAPRQISNLQFGSSDVIFGAKAVGCTRGKV
jgi:hypothetical protein